MKADVLEATFAMNYLEISLPVGAKALSSTTCTNNLAKELVVWSFDFVVVSFNESGLRKSRTGKEQGEKSYSDYGHCVGLGSWVLGLWT